MADDKQSFLIGRKSFVRIANATREVETARGLPNELRGPNRRRIVPIVEGILLEDLDGTDDPNVPTSANFQIKTAIQVGNGWANEPAPSIVKAYNRTPNSYSAETAGFAKELYQDKWYFYVGGGGGGADIIQFRPIDVCEGIGFSCDCVTAVVATGSCNSGLSPGDEVQVWDQSRGWFNMPEELLFNSIGWAHKVKVTEEEQYSLPFPIGPCRWVVFSMDPVEQEGY